MPVTPKSFAKSLLDELGIQPRPANVKALVAWQRAEGGNWNNSAHYNPLNTTLALPGSSSMNSVGVKAYQNWQQGVKATAETLKNGRYNDILHRLRSGTAHDIANAPSLSTWGTGSFANLLSSNVGPSGRQIPTKGGKGGSGAARGLSGAVSVQPGQIGVQEQPGTASDPGNQQVLQILGQVLSQPSQPAAASLPPLPAFAARPVLPNGQVAMVPSSGGPPQQSTQQLGALLDAIRTPGGNIPGAPTSQVTSSGGSVTAALAPGAVKAVSAPSNLPDQQGASRAVAYAEKQLAKGRHEPSGENRGPYVDKLNRSFGMIGQPWCAMFTSAAVTHGGAPSSARTASVAMVRQWATQKSHGYRGFVSSKKAQPGDLILFGNDHIGMVKANTGKGLVTVEGNYSDKVAQVNRAYGSGDVVRPAYKGRR